MENNASSEREPLDGANAKHSPGPRDTSRSRFNAAKHWMTARTGWLLRRDQEKDQEFIRRGVERIGPRNIVEHGLAVDLLNLLREEKAFAEMQRMMFLRRPVTVGPDDGRQYPFLDDLVGLHGLDRLTREFAHLTLAVDQAMSELLRVRKDNLRAAQSPTAVANQGGDAFPEKDPDTGAVMPAPGTLEEFLSSPLPIFPDENARDYETLARELWATFQPRNTLEGLAVGSCICAEWDLLRIPRVRCVALRRLGVSATGENCSVGFAFVHACQRNEALKSLRGYEAALRKRLHKRMALFRKIRQEGWADATPTQTQSVPEPQPSSLESRSSPAVAEPAQDSVSSTPEYFAAQPVHAAEPGKTDGDDDRHEPTGASASPDTS